MTAAPLAPVADPSLAADPLTAHERPYLLIVWDDPVNLMSYVSFVFRSYFGFTEEHAEELMLRVHHDGHAVVSSGPRERIEADVVAMHGFGLQASLRQAGQA